MTRDEAFQEYEEALAKIDKQSHEAREKARIALRERLKILRDTAHEELKAIRIIEQKTKRSRYVRRKNDEMPIL
uniref:Uncharacterized protein n=1 Tax=viral metagenome TaxID=1070528 RepID=A0A6H2A5H1_9ZZZZ